MWLLEPLGITAIEILYSDNRVRDSEKSCTRQSLSTQGLVASYKCQLNIKFPTTAANLLKNKKVLMQKAQALGI